MTKLLSREDRANGLITGYILIKKLHNITLYFLANGRTLYRLIMVMRALVVDNKVTKRYFL